MSANGDILLTLIGEDFGVSGHGRWYRSEEHSSLVIDYDKGIFFFNAEEIVGDPLVYLTKVRKMDFRNAKEYLKKFDYKASFVYTINTRKNEDAIVYPELVNVFYELGFPAEKREYWYQRGINNETIERFQLGWYNEYNMIPIFVDGTFRNFQMRKDLPERDIKSYYSGVGPLIFNSEILRYSNVAFICEGLTDCLRLNQEGVNAVSHNSGSEGWQEEWFKYFLKTKEIYVIFDADNAGRNGARRVSTMLGWYRTKIYTFDGYQKGYDIVNFFNDGGTKDQLLDLVTTKSKYIFELEGK